jgi:hypothetical protein
LGLLDFDVTVHRGGHAVAFRAHRGGIPIEISVAKGVDPGAKNFPGTTFRTFANRSIASKDEVHGLFVSERAAVNQLTQTTKTLVERIDKADPEALRQFVSHLLNALQQLEHRISTRPNT